MAVYGFIILFGSGYFLHHFRILMKYAGPVHHLSQVFNIAILQKLIYFGGRNGSAGGFKTGGGNARRNSEIEFEINFFAVFDHEFYTFHTEYISNFVWVRYGCNCAVYYSHAGKGGRNEHRAFDMDVGINKARQYVGG